MENEDNRTTEKMDEEVAETTATDAVSADTDAETPFIPKFIVPTQIDYMAGLDVGDVVGSEVKREVITDTYVTSTDEGEEAMLEKLDDTLNILSHQTHGFAGYLSFQYAKLTLFYLLHEYDSCFTILDSILKGVEAVEMNVTTGNYLDAEGKETGFVNYAFGEDDMTQTIKFIPDAWNFARYIHVKSSSFETGYSLLVAEMMLHFYNRQLGLVRRDCERMTELVEHIRRFIAEERDSGEEISTDVEYMSIDDLNKEDKEDGNTVN